jgi:hypothetical protein
MGEPFKDILIFYDGLGNTNVSWILDNRFDDPFPHVFTLEFSPNRAGFESNEYSLIAEGSKVAQLSDGVFRTAGMTNTAFYRVRLTTPAGTYYSPIKGLDGNVDRSHVGLLRELLRKEALLFRKDRGGVHGYLFKKRYYGPKCTCYDKNTIKLVTNACIKCAGTGFVDGFFPGIPFPILIENQEIRNSQITNVGNVDIRQLGVRCFANPVADSEDLWMETDTGKVYEIGKYTVAARLSYQPVAAKMEMKELPLVDSISLLIAATKDKHDLVGGSFTSPVRPHISVEPS